ncbi:MAG: ribonuclease HII [Candidatus Neomarinimicrobiota bacterium]|nr:MAG: ribonuclease HII [Candidatus Neomarinimicrobiota bacterium]
MALIAGVDEAGRGCLAGPVAAGAVILPADHGISGLRDSKKLSPRQREALFEKIQARAVAWSVGFVDHRDIDRINILQATFKAMQKALGTLSRRPDKALIDGSPLPNQIIPNEGIVDGDDQVDCIQAASIVAKVLRDRWMIRQSIIFPEYGFERNKGYGTRVHLEALEAWKASPIHRKSFRPVQQHLPTITWLEQTNRIGWMGEKLAALNLQQKGFDILQMNLAVPPYGEIDILARQQNTLVFVEVKSGSRMTMDMLVQKIDDQKIQRLYHAIDAYLSENPWEGSIRLDAMMVLIRRGGPRIVHYESIGS